MHKRLTRAAWLLAICALVLATSATAQEKAAPKTLQMTSSSIAAKTALVTALEEVTNIGGGRRFDAKLQAVIAADPSFALGRAYYAMWTSTLTPAQRSTELKRALTDAVANSTPAELIFINGLSESQAGRNGTARDLYDIVLKLTPDDPNVTFVRLLIAANADEARRIGEAAIARFPTYAPTYNLLAYRYNTDGRKEDALRTVAKYVELAPTHPNSHDSYAEILQLQGRLDEADKHYVSALKNDPQFDVALVGRAEIAILRGNYAAARPYITQALAMATTPARKITLQRQMAATYLYEGNLKAARSLLTTMVKDAETNGLNALPDKRALGFIAALEGDNAEAIKQYTAGKPVTPGVNAPFTDAVFHAFMKHPAEVNRAVTEMEASAAKVPENLDAQDAMRAARVIGAIINKDLNSAQSAQRHVLGPGYKALTGALLMQAANRAGNKGMAQSTKADVEAYKDLSMNAGFARLIAKQK